MVAREQPVSRVARTILWVLHFSLPKKKGMCRRERMRGKHSPCVACGSLWRAASTALREIPPLWGEMPRFGWGKVV